MEKRIIHEHNLVYTPWNWKRISKPGMGCGYMYDKDRALNVGGSYLFIGSEDIDIPVKVGDVRLGPESEADTTMLINRYNYRT